MSKVAWFFPGQGSQSVGMGKDVFAASAPAREILDRADAALGEKLSKIILEGPDETLLMTANAQPAIVTVSMAILAALRERVPNLPDPDYAAGHSLGEYSALLAAGALSFEDTIRIVRARGVAMQDAVPAGEGAMAAVMSIPPPEIEAICAECAEGDVLAPANFNGPAQVVIAGHARAVERAAKRVAEAKGKAVTLKVSAPFHCALMGPAARNLELALVDIAITDARFPIFANVNAEPAESRGEIRVNLIEQVTGPVRWEQSVLTMCQAGVTTAYEIGPGKVLAGLCKRINKELKVHNINDLASLDAAAKIISAS